MSTCSGAMSSLVAQEHKKKSLTGATGGSDLALWPVTPGSASITL